MPVVPVGGKRKPKHEPKPVKVSEKAQFLWAEGQQESGGNYHAVNANSGALGRWQVMPENLPGWLTESGLPQMSDQQYLDDPSAQDKLAWTILGGDYDRYGPRGAAAVWYSGQPDPNATYGDPPVYQYVDDVIALMRGAPAIAGSPGNLTFTGTQGVQTVSLGPPPTPGKESWSKQVRQTSKSFAASAGNLHTHSRTITSMKIRR